MQLRQYLIDCSVELSTKTPVYATLIGRPPHTLCHTIPRSPLVAFLHMHFASFGRPCRKVLRIVGISV
jgi:hypothetical protein